MTEKLEYGIHETVKVKGERVKSILLSFNPRLAPDENGVAALAPIVDLNKINIGLVIKRGNGKETIIHDGYLEDLLLALYGQTTRLQMAKKVSALGYLVDIDFGKYVLGIGEGDELVIRMKAELEAFGADVAKANPIILETVTSSNMPSLFVPVVRYANIGNGKEKIDMVLEDNCLKIVVATDYGANYDASEKAKIVDGVLTAEGDFEKIFTEMQLYVENRAYFTNNPDSDVEDLVVFWEQNPISGVKLRAKLSKVVDKDAKVLSLHRVVY